MARTPKIRANFDSDIQFLLRLKHAIEDDFGWPAEWRIARSNEIQALATSLMNRPVKIQIEESGGENVNDE